MPENILDIGGYPHLCSEESEQQGAAQASDLANRVTEELRAQGLPLTVRDPEVLRHVAALLGGEDAKARERRLAEVERELAGMEVRIRLDDQGDAWS
jgi:hypothetical protein